MIIKGADGRKAWLELSNFVLPKGGRKLTFVSKKRPNDYTAKNGPVKSKFAAYMSDQLSKEFSLLGKERNKMTSRITTQCYLMKCHADGDYMGIIKSLLQYKVDRFSKPFQAKDDVYGVGLLMVRRIFMDLTDQTQKFKLFFNATATLMGEVPFNKNTNTEISYVLLVDSFDKWLQGQPDSLGNKGKMVSTVDSYKDIVRLKNIDGTRFLGTRLFNETQIEEAKKLTLIYNPNPRVRKSKLVEDKSRYGNDLNLLKDINEPVKEASFIPLQSSQYQSKETLMNLFDQQLQTELTSFIRVSNFTRNSTEQMNAEEYIKTLNWEPLICENFKKRFAKLQNAVVKNFLSMLKAEEVAFLIHEEILKVLSEGMHLIHYNAFEREITESILKLAHNKFVTSTLGDCSSTLEKVYSDYVEYFIDEKLRRQYRPREYWIKCCDLNKITPEYALPFTDIDKSDLQKGLSTFLSQLIFDSCQISKDRLLRSRLTSQNATTINQAKSKFIPIFGIQTVNTPEESAILEDDDYRMNVDRFLSINKDFMRILDKFQFEFLVFPTSNTMPMIIPPKPWLDYGNGGPSLNYNYEIIRNKYEFDQVDICKETKKRIKSKEQGRGVWDALNELSMMPWRINKPVLDIMMTIFKNDCMDPGNEKYLDNLAFPLHMDAINIPSIEDILDPVKLEEKTISKHEFSLYYKMRDQLEQKKAQANSLTCWLLYRLAMANHFRDQILYFPHNMDFRGRVYPTSPYLSHMGDDVSRSLLVFAQGRPLGEKGLEWLKLHCINLTGLLKKESIDKRLQYVEEILENSIIESATNPLTGTKWWMTSEEPWQTLTACIEIKNALSCSDPTTFISHMPIHQDGSCNGLQHYAALGRDKQGGEEVNLLPSPKPADIYSGVAARVDIKRKAEESSEVDATKETALKLRHHIPQNLPRKLLKQTVMTTVYGVTEFGATLQIQKQLKAMGIPFDVQKELATYLMRHAFSSLSEAFSTSMALKEWFRQCAQAISQSHRSVEWITPLGLPVTQPYLKIDRIGGKVCHLPMMSKQVNAFPPNYVHSLDSSHMMLTALACSSRNITFAAVHDCFWTHAGTVDEMNTITREQFIKLHSEPLIENLSQHFKGLYLGEGALHMSTPQKGKLEGLFNKRIEKGQLDINQIMGSIYFFS
uniref:DNA-directed RNA polymerase n=1 Tax=Rhabditophanes sp. KR3021 TaxID=114890 RepID=A0AC35U9R0_9BILA